jgi:hypothetical protein
MFLKNPAHIANKTLRVGNVLHLYFSILDPPAKPLSFDEF